MSGKNRVRDGLTARELNAQFADVLTPAAIDFVTRLHHEFAAARGQLLQTRAARRGLPLSPTPSATRADLSWQAAPAPADLQDRRVEIASPAQQARVVISALKSGAQVWVADLEDAMAPTWANVLASQRNLLAAVTGTLWGANTARPSTLPAIMVRPRGWHLPEHAWWVAGQPASASLVDFGLYFFHCAHLQLARQSGPYFYLPKLENQQDAQLWRQVFAFAEQQLGLPTTSIRATALIEHIGAAYEMEEILYALGPYAAGLTAGRWDYLFSIARRFPQRVLPDRSALGMDQPFMRAYTRQLIDVCHRRGTHAIGGVAPQIPDRKNPLAHAQVLALVKQEKQREAAEGFDGAWVIHPDLVQVCADAFAETLQGQAHQISRPARTEPALPLWSDAPIAGQITAAGLRSNVSVCLRYLDAWLRGVGSVNINGLMEGVATVEIARAQIWQWLQQRVTLADGRRVVPALVRRMLTEETLRYLAEHPAQVSPASLQQARRLFEKVALSAGFVDFLTLPGYAMLCEPHAPLPDDLRLATCSLPCSSGMFTVLQLKPRIVLACAFMAWSAWLLRYAVSHAALVQDHATGFVPIGLEIDYLDAASFFDCTALDITASVQTCNPARFHSLQDVLVLLQRADGKALARVYIQEICVRIESMATLAAAPGRVPAALVPLLLPDETHETPLLLNRPLAPPPAPARLIAQHQHRFTVHRHACEGADQWYSEHVCDFIGDSREAMVLALRADYPALSPGLSQPLAQLRVGLRQPLAFLDEASVVSQAYAVADELHFMHQIFNPRGEVAADAIEVFRPAAFARDKP